MPTPLMLGNLVDMVEGFPAVDLQTGANNGDYVSLKNADRAAVVFISGLGTAGQDPTLTIEQATSNAGGGVKALNFTVIYRKQAATDLTGTAVWTRTTQTAANTYTNATSAEESLIWWVEFDASELDVDNAFDHIRGTVADIGGAAQPGYLFYLLKPKYPNLPANVMSAL